MNMRTNFNHILHFEDDLSESVKSGTVSLEHATPIILLEIAKALNIIADNLDNIERRLDSDPHNTLH